MRRFCRVHTLLDSTPALAPFYAYVLLCIAEIQKRERKRRGRAAQETRAAKKEARLEQDRTDRIAAMREFTVDLQVRKTAYRAYVCRCFVVHHTINWGCLYFSLFCLLFGFGEGIDLFFCLVIFVKLWYSPSTTNLA